MQRLMWHVMRMGEINVNGNSVGREIRQRATGLDAKVLVSGRLGYGPPRALHPQSRPDCSA